MWLSRLDKAGSNILWRSLRTRCMKHCMRLSSSWRAVIGLEVHAQISSKSKLFSGSVSDFFGPLNTTASFFDCALPGTLPALNKRCVEAAVMTSLALNCQLNMMSRFDRKHYFYADLPAGYQITQQNQPIARNGWLEYYDSQWHRDAIPSKKTVKIRQIQLEQDSGKSFHDYTKDRTLVDLNRAGCALMEIVFDHSMTSGLEAADLITELINTLKDLDTCGCRMDKGQLRVDANISVHKEGEPLGVKTEVKNLNSVRFVRKAVDYEIQRQISCLEAGHEITNTTMTFDYKTGMTSPMRDKEVRQDYRYMPEPNLPPLRLFDKNNSPPAHVDIDSVIDVDLIKAGMPRFLRDKRESWIHDFQIPLITALNIYRRRDIAEFFDNCINCNTVQCDALLIARKVIGLMKKYEKELLIRPLHFAHLCSLLSRGEITEFTFDELLDYYNTDASSLNILPRELVEQRCLTTIIDEQVLGETCDEILSTEEKAIFDYKRGKKKTMSRFTRRANEKLRGRAPIDILEQIFTNKLEK